MATRNLCVIILALCIVVPISSATVYTVGDTSGWSTGMDYSTWASDKTFVVGDSLVFNYGRSHNVAEVSPTDYAQCNAANAISRESSGTTTVQLKTAGKHYYVCGVPGHCSGGMKLSVSVSPSTGGTSTDGSTTTTAPAGTSTTTTPATTGSHESSSSPIAVVFSGFVSFITVWLCFLAL